MISTKRYVPECVLPRAFTCGLGRYIPCVPRKVYPDGCHPGCDIDKLYRVEMITIVYNIYLHI